MTYAMGVDIGGTKIAAAIIDDEGHRYAHTEYPSITTDQESMFRQVVCCLEETIRQSNLDLFDLRGMGFGVPGKVDHVNGIALYQNNIPWENFPLVQRIREYFSVENVIIDNDVYMAAYAEWVMQGKNEQETFVYLTISTGISCCTIHNGDFIRGAGFAGEIGFLPVKKNHTVGEWQRLEEAAAGPGIVHAAQPLQDTDSRDSITTAQIIENYKNGDAFATRIMKEAISDYAKGLYAISCLLDPDKLVFGGGVMNHHPDLLVPIQKELAAYLVPDQKALLERMTVSQIQGGSGLVGAGLRACDY